MAVQLEIQDGVPWWSSNDIWTVPGDDPEGPVGLPIVGQPCYLWAHAQNKGTTSVQDAQVRFYWANPSVGFDRSTANVIGTSNVSLAPGAAADVLCLMPWIPVFVNGGHECVLAEAFHTSLDPLPASLAFDVPTDRHVAQRNLEVLMAAEERMFHLAFEIHNPGRKETEFGIVVREGDPKEAVLATRRYPELQKILKNAKAGSIKGPGLVTGACPDPDNHNLMNHQQLKLRATQRSGLSVVGHLAGDFALLHVEQRALGQNRKAVMGGLTILVVNEKVHHA